MIKLHWLFFLTLVPVATAQKRIFFPDEIDNKSKNPGVKSPVKSEAELPIKEDEPKDKKCLCISKTECLTSVITSGDCSSNKICCPIENISKEGFFSILLNGGEGQPDVDQATSTNAPLDLCTCAGKSSCSQFEESEKKKCSNKKEKCCPNNNLFNYEGQYVVCTCVPQKFCTQKIYMTAPDAQGIDCDKGEVCCPNTKITTGTGKSNGIIIERCECVEKALCEEKSPSIVTQKALRCSQNQICCPKSKLLKQKSLENIPTLDADCLCVPASSCNTKGNEDLLLTYTTTYSASACVAGKICCPADYIISEESCSNCIHDVAKSHNIFKCGFSSTDGKYDRRQRLKFDTTFTEFPWTVAIVLIGPEYSDNGILRNRKTFLCNGVLIHPEVVLTSANCLIKHGDANLKIIPGEWDLSVPPIYNTHFELSVKKRDIHPGFAAEPNLQNDAALLYGHRDIIMSPHFNTICLSNNPIAKYNTADCVVAGWGDDARRIFYPMQQKSSVSFASDRNCEHIHDSFMYVKGIESVNMREGAALVCKIKGKGSTFIMMGIRSALECPRKGQEKTTVYTPIQNVVDWIKESVVRELGIKATSYFIFE